MEDAPARRLIVEAYFDDTTQARGAVLVLEGKGIDAEYISLQGPNAVPSQVGARQGDLALGREVLGSAVTGALIGALVGTVVLLLAVMALGFWDRPGVLVGAAIAGAIAGSALGGFWGAGRRLPVTEDAYDAYFIDPVDPVPVRVEVRVTDRDEADTAAEALWAVHPQRVERRVA